VKALAVEITHARNQRERAANEYIQSLLATRRAMHELELLEIDVRAAEMRRIIADDLLERAKAGLLGIEYNGVPAELPTPVS